METVTWQTFAAALAGGALGGLAFWCLARLALAIAAAIAVPWPAKPPFATELLAGAGERERLRHRALGRELAALLGAMLTGLLVGLLTMALSAVEARAMLPVWSWIPAALFAMALFAAGVWFTARVLRERRRLRFTWAAKAAVGDILKRLNFAGNRVFHEVAVEGATIDHVVVGLKGVFAVNVVARPAPRKANGHAQVELRNGKLSLGGQVEALPVGDAARNMSLLTAALTRIIGHRVTVRSVLAVPGWNTAPNNGGNHLLMNEGNLPMITSWNTPDVYLMEEDCAAIQKFLHGASRAQALG